MKTVSKPKTLTKWEIVRFTLWFEVNESLDAWFASYDLQGNVMENFQFHSAPGVYYPLTEYIEVAQAGTYKFELKNCNTQDTHVFLHIYIEETVFEKPYFYYGVLGITIAVLYPTFLFLGVLVRSLVSKFKRNNHLK
ncbi:MAG: hypothetical protein QXL57_05115 [Candidatus Bathyarchaeia archaeon]